MKLVKNILLVITLVAINSVSAKNRGGMLASKQTKAPAAMPKKSFQMCLQDVRKMKPADVINAQGVFTDKFQTFISSLNFGSDFTQALMEAGRNLHMPLSGDMLKDKETLINSHNNILNFLSQPEAAIVYQPELPTLQTPDFYNESTNLLNENYLQNRSASIEGDRATKIKVLENELLPKMQDRWDSEGGFFTNSYKKNLSTQVKKQISDIVRGNEPISAKPVTAPQPKTQTLQEMAYQLVSDNITNITKNLFKETADDLRFNITGKKDNANSLVKSLASTLQNKTGLEIEQVIELLFFAIKQGEYSKPVYLDGLKAFLKNSLLS